MNWMNKDRIEKWFTYQEVGLKINSIFQTRVFPEYPYYPLINSNWWTNAMIRLDLRYSFFELSDSITDTQRNDIINYLMDVVYNRFSKFYLYGIIIDEDRELTNDEVKNAITIILDVLVNTAPKYIPIFIQNKKSNADLLAKPTSSSNSVSRFNDTPQNGGLFEDDDHTSNISESSYETSADMGSLVERLNDAFNNFHSITLEWSNEFARIFLSEEQI